MYIIHRYSLKPQSEFEHIVNNPTFSNNEGFSGECTALGLCPVGKVLADYTVVTVSVHTVHTPCDVSLVTNCDSVIVHRLCTCTLHTLCALSPISSLFAYETACLMHGHAHVCILHVLVHTIATTWHCVHINPPYICIGETIDCYSSIGEGKRSQPDTQEWEQEMVHICYALSFCISMFAACMLSLSLNT